MMAVLHVYLKYTQPLFVQAIMAFKTLYDSKLFKIYVLGRPIEGDLKRPFKTPSMFGGSSCLFLPPRLSSSRAVTLCSWWRGEN
jgi:hypothetical protein